MTGEITQLGAIPSMETYVAISLLEKTLQVSLAAPSALPWLGNLHQLNPKQLHAQLEA
jgi:hypothetical protein